MVGPETIAVLTGVAAVAACIDAIAGGGGLITLPALLWAGLPPQMALGTNKAQSSFGTALAAWRYHRAGLYTLRVNLPAVAAVLAGAALGTWAVERLDPTLLRLAVPVLLVGAALYTLLSPRMRDENGPERLTAGAYTPVAGVIGGYDGFFGPGAGQFYALSLVSLRGLSLTRATGLTKLFNLTSNAASLAVFALGGRIIWPLGLAMAAGAMAGAWTGAHFATRHGARLIRPVLVCVSLALTARLLWGWFAG